MSQDELERFYEHVLGLVSLGLGRRSAAFRLGQGVPLLFERERSAAQDEPPPHGASGSIHTAFLAAPGEYDARKQRLADRDLTLIDEIAWGSGVRSCSFNDPAGNLLEIAERDLWAESEASDPAGHQRQRAQRTWWQRCSTAGPREAIAMLRIMAPTRGKQRFGLTPVGVRSRRVLVERRHALPLRPTRPANGRGLFRHRAHLLLEVKRRRV